MLDLGISFHYHPAYSRLRQGAAIMYCSLALAISLILIQLRKLFRMQDFGYYLAGCYNGISERMGS